MLNNNLTFSILPFNKLDLHSFYEIAKVRESVFVVEQQCIYQELDNKDTTAWHIQGKIDGKLAVYARILPPSVDSKHLPAIGRVLTVKQFRGQNFAKLLMRTAIDFCQTKFPNQAIYISAQTYLINFYQSLCFIPQGSIYLEDGIEHIDMIFEPSIRNV